MRVTVIPAVRPGQNLLNNCSTQRFRLNFLQSLFKSFKHQGGYQLHKMELYYELLETI